MIFDETRCKSLFLNYLILISPYLFLNHFKHGSNDCLFISFEKHQVSPLGSTFIQIEVRELFLVPIKTISLPIIFVKVNFFINLNLMSFTSPFLIISISYSSILITNVYFWKEGKEKSFF